jgi:hypothetical protein
MNNRKKVVIISLDYDYCGDILFDDRLSTLKKDEEISRAKECQESLTNYLKELSKNASATELYVGSMRQDIRTDEANIQEFKNGSCFKNYADFCEKHGFTFNKFLLPDAQNNHSSGTTMGDRIIQTIYYPELPPPMRDEKAPTLYPALGSKVVIICQQLENASKEHPDADIDFYFFDDDSENTYLNEIKDHFLKHKPPSNISNLYLFKYDWDEKVSYNADEAILRLHTHLKQKQASSDSHTSTAAILSVISEAPVIPKPEVEIKDNAACINQMGAQEANIKIEESETLQSCIRFSA